MKKNRAYCAYAHLAYCAYACVGTLGSRVSVRTHACVNAYVRVYVRAHFFFNELLKEIVEKEVSSKTLWNLQKSLEKDQHLSARMRGLGCGLG